MDQKPSRIVLKLVFEKERSGSPAILFSLDSYSDVSFPFILPQISHPVGEKLTFFYNIAAMKGLDCSSSSIESCFKLFTMRLKFYQKMT